MSEETRDYLTWLCLVLLGFSCWRFSISAHTATRVFNTMRGGAWPIRDRLTRGKTLLMASAASFFLCIQGWVPFVPELRAVFFIAGCDFMAMGSLVISRGWQLWWKDLNDWAYNRERGDQADPDEQVVDLLKEG